MNPPPPGPVSVLSATHEANAAARHASTAFPPSARISAPASAVSRCPAAIAPLIARKRKAEPGGHVRCQAPDASEGRAGLALVRLPHVERRYLLMREAMLAARPPPRSPHCSSGWAPRERSGCPRLPADGLPARRLRALEQLLVRRPLQLRHVQRPLLPARRAVRNPAARDRVDRDGRARLRGRRRPAVGAARALVEQDVRGRLGRAGHLGGVPVRARRRARAARALGARRPASGGSSGCSPS